MILKLSTSTTCYKLQEPEAPSYGLKKTDIQEKQELLEKLLEKRIARADAGELIPLENVMKEMGEKFPFLKK